MNLWGSLEETELGDPQRIRRALTVSRGAPLFHGISFPIFERDGENTRSILFAPQPLTRMDQADRVRACYLHACLKYVDRDFLTNASIRERFGIEKENSAMASRYIREAVEAGVIRAVDSDASKKYMKYVPFWA